MNIVVSANYWLGEGVFFLKSPIFLYFAEAVKSGGAGFFKEARGGKEGE